MRYIRKNDILLAIILLFAGLGLFLIFSLVNKPGEYVNISVDGYICKTVSINEDAVIRIPETGEDYNVIEIKDGKVYVSYADCPDKICVKHKPILEVGQTIICLPHKLTVSVSGHDAGKEMTDGTTY